MGDEYSFLQETIKDEAGSKKKLKNKILKIIGFGFLFGIVASFAFFVSQPWIEDMFGSNPEKVTIPEDEEQTEEEAETITTISESEDSFRQVLHEFHEITREASRSMVAVEGFKSKEQTSEENAQAVQSVTGAIVADNGQELLILGTILSDENTEEIKITFADGKSCSASVKKQDENLGFGIYAVSRKEIEETTWSQIKVATLGNSNLVQSGDTVIVLGKSFAGADVVNYGIAASTEERMEAADGYFRLIRVDVAGADIKDGFLVSPEGEVLGALNDSDEDTTNKMLITAYSISDIKGEIECLSNGQGVPYLGIYGVEITGDMIKTAGYDQGVYVKDIEADSPAMASGIQMGDIITQVGETEVINLQEYRGALLQYYAGQQLILKGSRLGANDEYVEIEFTLTVGTKE